MNQSSMKKGDIWKIHSGNSPMFTEQWLYQGSAKVPYIVSYKKTHQEPWQCSCPHWINTVPREDCKHIEAVRIQGDKNYSKVQVEKKKLKLHNLQEQIKTLGVKIIQESGASPLKTFKNQGRRFR